MAKTKKQDRITHISRVVLEGYKSIDHLEIDLVKGFNILIGKNGSGKSNFLNLLYSVFYSPSPLGQAPIGIYYNSARILLGTENGIKIDWYTERNKKNELHEEPVYNFLNINDGELYKREVLNIDKNEIFDSIKLKDGLLELNNNEKINVKYFRAFYYVMQKKNIIPPGLIFIRYNIPNVITAVNIPGNISIDKKNFNTIFLQSNMQMISTFLGNFTSNYLVKYIYQKIKLDRDQILLKLEFPDSVILNLKKFSPIQDIRVSPNINIYEDENKTSIENIILEFYVNNGWVPWSYLSDGTKRLFYLISEISYFQDAIILIEEPELGIHPDQFNSIMNFLKEESENKQIIMSTHSPEALNILNENELQNIIVTKYDKKKGTTLSHLNKQQVAKAKAYMKELDLSDYWLQSDMEG